MTIKLDLNLLIHNICDKNTLGTNVENHTTHQ